MKIDSEIFDVLAELGKSAKKAYDATDKQPSSHPVKDVPDVGGGDKATTGSEYSTQEDYSKENAGTQGVDSAEGDSINPVKKDMHDRPQQKELNPGKAGDPVPEDIKPKNVVNNANDDFVEPTSEPETGDGGEGRVGGVGGPKFASANAFLNKADSWLKAANGPDPKPEVKKVNKVAVSNKLTESKVASVIHNTLKQASVSPAASVEVKTAELARALEAEATKHAYALALSQDSEVAKAISNGSFTLDHLYSAFSDNTKVAEAAPVADPAMAADPEQELDQLFGLLADSINSGEITPEDALDILGELGIPPEALAELFAGLEGAPGEEAIEEAPVEEEAAEEDVEKEAKSKRAMMDPTAGGPPVEDPAMADPAMADPAMGAPPAGGEDEVSQMIEQVLMAVDAGEISMEEAIQMLQELGVPPEVLEQIMAELQGAEAGADPMAGGDPMMGDAPEQPGGMV